ncbi:hypothetical protein [Haploplasma modicum]|uniref:hypothetical protein n=1 Tax=Haploplasma modicum TaxID=2150 RepID=UPI00047ACD50|nr:hypothetical protein [Haploplasma modicum]
MEELETVLSYISTSLIVIVAIITYLMKLISNLREIKKLKSNELISEELIRLISLAEELFDKSTDRKKFVTTRLERFGKENKIKYDIKKIDEEIDEVIKFTKKVNYKTKDGLIDGN